MKRITRKLVFNLALLLGLYLTFGAGQVWATGLSTAWIRYDRMQENKLSSLQILLVPTTVGTEDRIVIVFGSATVGTSQAVTLTNLPLGSTELPGTLVAAKLGTSAVAITGIANLTVGTTYAFNLAVGVSNPTAGTTVDVISTRSDATTVIDSTNIASRYITNDQIVVTAIVPPTFNFVLGGNADTFTSNLDVGSSVSTTGNTLTITTNADKGWIAWVKSANAGLVSLTTGEIIPTTEALGSGPSTLINGVNGYVLDVNLTTDHATGTGAVTIATEYNGTDTGQGGTLSLLFQPIATADGTTAGDVLTLIERATISGVMPAANDYTDTLTVVGAGAF